jgi:hypothetical protein
VILSLAWKEYREHRPVWITMALVATTLLVVITQVFPALGILSLPSDSITHVIVAAAGSVLTYGVVCGAMMLAGERELGTLAFLDALTGQRFPVWFAKMLPGTILCVLQGLLVAAVAMVLIPEALPVRPVLGLVALPAVALDAFIWGLLASALCRSVLTAAGLAALFWLLGWLLVLPCGAFEIPALPIFGRLALDGFILCLSALLFCQTETPERLIPTAAPLPRRTRIVPPPRLRHVLVWLPLRQGWVIAVVLGVLALLLGLFLPAGGPVFWISFTLIVGVMCGTSAFGNEQTEGSSRFLGNQRFPIGRVWAMKIGFWLAVAVAVSGLFLLMGVVAHVASTARPVPGGQAAEPHTFFGVFVNPHNWYILAPLGLLYGFAIGQFYSLLWKKSVVAVVMALLVSPGFAFIWLPSLVFGGLHLWQVVVPPLVLLAATRLVLWAWASSGLAAWRPGATLAGCGLLSISWIGGMLCYRYLEVPGVPDPVDLQAYLDSLPSAERNLAGLRIRTAGEEFLQQVRFSGGPPPLPPLLNNKQEYRHETTGAATELARAIEKGWPQDNQVLGKWLDDFFTKPPPEKKKMWHELYREAASLELGVIEDVLLTSLRRELTSARRCTEAATFFQARALQLQAMGRSKESLDLLFLMLDLSRHLRNHALTGSYHMGQRVEDMALRGLEQWLAHKQGKDLLRLALEKLSQHEKIVPPVSNSVKAEYARMRRQFDTGGLFHDIITAGTGVASNAESEAVSALWYAPWERARYVRVLNALTAAALKAADCEPQEAAELLTPEPTNHNEWESRIAINRGLTLIDEGGRNLSPIQWSRLLRNNMVVDTFQVGTLGNRLVDALGQSRLRAARLQVGLLLYQAEHDEPAPDLAALVNQRYLPALPLDPFNGQPFRYRLADKEETIIWGPADDPGVRDVAKGQGVLWSVGPDGIDHGGTKQGMAHNVSDVRNWKKQGFDVIFLVPRWQ